MKHEVPIILRNESTKTAMRLVFEGLDNEVKAITQRVIGDVLESGPHVEEMNQLV